MKSEKNQKKRERGNCSQQIDMMEDIEWLVLHCIREIYQFNQPSRSFIVVLDSSLYQSVPLESCSCQSFEMQIIFAFYAAMHLDTIARLPHCVR